MKLFRGFADLDRTAAEAINKEIAAATERINELTAQLAAIEQNCGEVQTLEEQRRNLREALAEAYYRRADAELLVGLREDLSDLKKNA